MEESTNQQFPWNVTKLVALTETYLDLRLPLPVAVRSAAADLQQLG